MSDCYWCGERHTQFHADCAWEMARAGEHIESFGTFEIYRAGDGLYYGLSEKWVVLIVNDGLDVVQRQVREVEATNSGVGEADEA